nr:hypothetical protein Iba_chr06dCG7880 [Ipomoea batatas]
MDHVYLSIGYWIGVSSLATSVSVRMSPFVRLGSTPLLFHLFVYLRIGGIDLSRSPNPGVSGRRRASAAAIASPENGFPTQRRWKPDGCELPKTCPWSLVLYEEEESMERRRRRSDAIAITFVSSLLLSSLWRDAGEKTQTPSSLPYPLLPHSPRHRHKKTDKTIPLLVLEAYHYV